jgi:hypothetical protein
VTGCLASRHGHMVAVRVASRGEAAVDGNACAGVPGRARTFALRASVCSGMWPRRTRLGVPTYVPSVVVPCCVRCTWLRRHRAGPRRAPSVLALSTTVAGCAR